MRLPVKYKKLVLMPMRWKRIKRLMKEGKGILVRDKILGLYFKLKYKPKSTETQSISLGIDPGSMFDGYSIISKSNQINLQFNHQLAISKSLKSIMNKRIEYRRLRRYRLRFRPMRIESRNGCKISNTSNYYFQNRVNMIKRIISFYPIKLISIEDVSYNHYLSNKGKSFSNIEIGKNKLYDYITNELKLNLYKSRGKETKDIREMIFIDRLKNKDKSIRDFNSHCIDSFTLGVIGLVNYMSNLRIYTKFMSNRLLNTSVTFIDRIKYKYRRELHRLKNKIRDSRFYFRYRKGGVRINIDHKSKLKKLRLKINDTKSNHGKIWNYIYTNPDSTYKKFITNYGGTIGKDGVSKYWNGKYYKYYEIEII